MIEKLFKELENIKQENKELKDSIGILNKRIEKLERNNKIEKSFINKNKHTIEKANNMINLNINHDEDEDPIKIELLLQYLLFLQEILFLLLLINQL